MSLKLTAAPVGALAVVSLLLTSCGADPAEPGAEGVTSLRVGVLPTTDVLPLYVAIEEGIFEEHGLEVEPVPAQGGAAIVPSVLEGSVDMSFTNTVSHMIAVEQGLPLGLVSNAYLSHEPGQAPDAEHPSSTLLVGADSAIQSPADLEGKIVAINSLGNIQEVAVRNSIEQAGGDPSKVQLLELPLSQMQGALEGGRVDAISVNEPFTTLYLDAGDRIIGAPFTDFEESASDIAWYFATEEYATENAEVVESFRTAMEEANTFVLENPEEARDVIQTYTDVSDDVAGRVTLPYYTSAVSSASVEEIARKSVDYGLLDEMPDVDQVIGDVPTIEESSE